MHLFSLYNNILILYHSKNLPGLGCINNSKKQEKLT